MAVSSEFLDGLTPSAIRDITASIREKKSRGIDVVNFAGGMPDAAYFPVKELKQITDEIIEEDSGDLFQYAATDGYLPLREALSDLMKRYQVAANPAEILITSGSAQALNYLSRALICPGDTVLIEEPVYVGAVDTLKSYGPKLVGIPMEEDGMDLEELEKALRKGRASFIYTVPDFQNPSGSTMSVEKRERLVRLAEKYDTYIIEDSPYSLLSFSGGVCPAVKSFDREGRVVYLGSVSKTICPGLRVGWICADQESVRKLIYLKQRDDLQVNNLAQRQVHRYLTGGSFDAHLQEVCGVYKQRMESMLEAVRTYFPKDAVYIPPRGGIFLWLELGGGIDARKLFPYILNRRIAFVPGSFFYANGGGKSTMRLNFCTNEEAVIREKIREMGLAIQAWQAERK